MVEQSTRDKGAEKLVWIYWYVNNTPTSQIRKVYERRNGQDPLRNAEYVKDQKKRLRARYGVLPEQVEYADHLIERGNFVPEDITRAFVAWLERNNVRRPQLAVGPLLPVPKDGDRFRFGERRPEAAFNDKARRGTDAERALREERRSRQGEPGTQLVAQPQQAQPQQAQPQQAQLQQAAPQVQPEQAQQTPQQAPQPSAQPAAQQQSTPSTASDTETGDPRRRLLDGLDFEQRLEKKLEERMAALEQQLKAKSERLERETKELKERIEREAEQAQERERQRLEQARQEHLEQILAESRELRNLWEREAQAEQERIAGQYRERQQQLERERERERERMELEQRERAALVTGAMREVAEEQKRQEQLRQQEREQDRLAQEAKELERHQLEQARHKRELDQELARRKRDQEQQERTAFLEQQLEAERKQRELLEQRLRDLERGLTPDVLPVRGAGGAQTHRESAVSGSPKEPRAKSSAPAPSAAPDAAPAAAPSTENKRSLPEEFDDSIVELKRRRESSSEGYSLEWLEEDRKRLISVKASVYQVQAYDIAIGAIKKFGPMGYSHPLAREALRQLVAYAPEVSVMIAKD